MGKIVKYCANCEESFAEKFSFCPNCAAGLSAYEMSPVNNAPIAPPEPIKSAAPAPIVSNGNGAKFEAKPTEPAPVNEKDEFKTFTEPQADNAPTAEYKADGASLNSDENVSGKKAEEPKPIVEEVKPAVKKSTPVTIVPAAVAPSNPDDYSRTYAGSAAPKSGSTKNSAKVADVSPVASKPSTKTYSDGGYNITFVEEKNNGVRRGLLLGAFLLVTTAAIAGLVISLYTSDALVGSLNEDMVLLAPEVQAEVVEEPPTPDPPKAKTKDDAGGGGGGGKQEQLETSKGQLAPQMDKPLIAPSVTMDRVTKPDIKIQMATQGKADIKQTDEKYGNPTSTNLIASDGTGSGGGQGSGVGRGQGSGRGTGAGSGIGSGLGSGVGDGIGGGRGSGTDGDDNDPPKIAVGPTEGVKVTAKPRANYTDSARQAQIQGTVTLRVTFLANGTIGSISTVSGLPNGLTEQAIAAARGMRFEPAKKSGVAYTVTKQVQYNFTLY